MNFILNLHEGNEYISKYIRAYNCWEPLTTELILELFKQKTIMKNIQTNKTKPPI